MKSSLNIFFLTYIGILALIPHSPAQPSPAHNLVFNSIPQRWDEAIPLGNGMLGALIWQKGDKLRIAIDRADLWDLRPTREIEKYTYQWAYQHKLSGDWDTVWKVADEPYDRDPAPTRIPGAALEFGIKPLGEVKSVVLDIHSAICTILWKSGVELQVFMDATNHIGRYRWKGAKLQPEMKPPPYSSSGVLEVNNEVVDGQDLKRLGYPPGKIIRRKNRLIYEQDCHNPLKYQVAIRWKHLTNGSEGGFSISAHYSDRPQVPSAAKLTRKLMVKRFEESAVAHREWWDTFWNMSEIRLPEPVLENQWYLEMYKFGSASRKGSPPISLQAVWTADNGRLPPWKGDYHNDLNTQMSYWPGYTANHLEESEVFTDWLWEHRDYFECYTRRVFGVKGINVPGVATLRGREMGGWHMYAMSPTVSCWLAQHFYLQWRYSMDRDFLINRAYPWVKGVATYLEGVLQSREGQVVLPLSSSPEFNDGGIDAWFTEMTNFDRALCRYAFRIAAEMARDVGIHDEGKHWKELGEQVPELVIDSSGGLSIAPGFPYNASHRHFSHMMAIYPLGLLYFENEENRKIMDASIRNLENQGTDWWCGYSFSWAANIYARMKRGEDAVKALRIFTDCFCSSNSFHLNGDQCKTGHSKLTYRPFTLEGNFAFASGIQEMLLQSHAGYIEVFPAIPAEWKNVSFDKLRAQGAFLVSAWKENGVITRVKIVSKKGGEVKLKFPFRTHIVRGANHARIISQDKQFVLIDFTEGGTIELENGYE